MAEISYRNKSLPPPPVPATSDTTSPLPCPLPNTSPATSSTPNQVESTLPPGVTITSTSSSETILPTMSVIPPPLESGSPYRATDATSFLPLNAPKLSESPGHQTPQADHSPDPSSWSSYFSPQKQQAGSIYTLSRVSFTNQLAQLTSLQLPNADLLSTKLAAIPTAHAASRALTNAADQIVSWITKAAEVIQGLDSDDDAEWAAAGGREGLHEVEDAITRFEGLINVYITALENVQSRPDIAAVPGQELQHSVQQMEGIIQRWSDIRKALKAVKQQVELAMEWEELWNLVYGDLQSEMDQLSSAIFEMEEIRHYASTSTVNASTSSGTDLHGGHDQFSRSRSGSQHDGGDHRPLAHSLSPPLAEAGLELGKDPMDALDLPSSDSKLLSLYARMQPLRASLEFLPMKLSSFVERAKSVFPSACDELIQRRETLETSYKALEKDIDSLHRELGEDRWVTVFRGAGNQAQKMCQSIAQSIAVLQEALQQQLYIHNLPSMAQKTADYDAKKTHYSPAIERVLGIIDRGIQDRLTVNGEVLRLRRDTQAQWTALQKDINHLDRVLENRQWSPPPTSMSLSERQASKWRRSSSPSHSTSLYDDSISLTSGSHLDSVPASLTTSSTSPRSASPSLVSTPNLGHAQVRVASGGEPPSLDLAAMSFQSSPDVPSALLTSSKKVDIFHTPTPIRSKNRMSRIPMASPSPATSTTTTRLPLFTSSHRNTSPAVTTSTPSTLATPPVARMPATPSSLRPTSQLSAQRSSHATSTSQSSPIMPIASSTTPSIRTRTSSYFASRSRNPSISESTNSSATTPSEKSHSRLNTPPSLPRLPKIFHRPSMSRAPTPSIDEEESELYNSDLAVIDDGVSDSPIYTTTNVPPRNSTASRLGLRDRVRNCVAPSAQTTTSLPIMPKGRSQTPSFSSSLTSPQSTRPSSTLPSRSSTPSGERRPSIHNSKKPGTGFGNLLTPPNRGGELRPPSSLRNTRPLHSPSPTPPTHNSHNGETNATTNLRSRPGSSLMVRSQSRQATSTPTPTTRSTSEIHTQARPLSRVAVRRGNSSTAGEAKAARPPWRP